MTDGTFWFLVVGLVSSDGCPVFAQGGGGGGRAGGGGRGAGGLGGGMMGAAQPVLTRSSRFW